LKGKRWKGGSKHYCAIVTLDIKNAFNSAQWSCIMAELRCMGVPPYIRRVIRSYFRNRIQTYGTQDGPRTYRVTGGVPQGSVLGPTLWNIMYDGILRLQLPEGANAIGFADDVAVVVVAKHLEDLTWIADKAIAILCSWLSSVGLTLADQKTEVVLLSSRKRTESITLTVGDAEILSQSSVRYLGVHIDSRLTFRDHLQKVSEKAAKVVTALSRIMPNIGGPRQNRRKLLASVTTSIMMYAAPVWADSVRTTSYKRQLVSVYRRSALRVVCGFRTVSYEAACVLSGMVPIELLAEERRRMYCRGRQNSATDRQMVTMEEKDRTSSAWQDRWDKVDKGRWTHRLIPNIKEWTSRRHGELDYYVTQFLTGHGCFRAYQHRFKIDDNPSCPACIESIEDAEHVLFVCPRFQVERAELQTSLGRHLEPENLVSLMTETREAWDAVSRYAVSVIRSLRILEKERRDAV